MATTIFLMSTFLAILGIHANEFGIHPELISLYGKSSLLCNQFIHTKRLTRGGSSRMTFEGHFATVKSESDSKRN